MGIRADGWCASACRWWSFLVAVQPLADVVGSRRDEVPVGYAAALRSTEFGVLWFVFAILVFSSVYAGVRGSAAATGRAGAAWWATRPARRTRPISSTRWS